MSSGVSKPAEHDRIRFLLRSDAKEILEQHATIHPQNEVKAEALDLLAPDRLPKQAMPLPKAPVRSWDALAALVRVVNQWSLSAVTYPALDLGVFDSAPREVKERYGFEFHVSIVYRSAARAESTLRRARLDSIPDHVSARGL